ncbi:exopolysaccharide biosynthesis protein [Streptococcus pseudoporcinus]|uniref:Exopolysaccharide biosynthesis protein n=1 Tax=Streptococcus pseudoporcinus TaxID=361101 RepID=A0A4U9YKZ9_9STRE|nr:polysaccharide biosynthesis C-terminal domain-containing protein [Streptococcus pseudoporcinus]VTS27239.1 exopolysaccharide biosynthesis protein [Streptococcus pseudoporcinus]
MNNHKKDLIVHTFVRILGGLIAFISVFLLTYIFPATEIGKYNLILSSINISMSLGTLWLTQSILRYYHVDKNLGFIISLSIYSLITSVVFYIIFAFIFKQEINFWILTYIVIFGIYSIGDSFFRSSNKIYYYMFLELAISIGKIFPMYFLAITFKSINAIFASQILLVSLLLLYLIIRNFKRISNFNYRVDWIEFKKYLKFGFPLVGLTISNWVLSASDRYIISFLGNNSQVGIYSTNYLLANSIYMMFSLIVLGAFHPMIMREWHISKESTEKLVNQSLDIYLGLMIPLSFYGILKSHILLSLFKGVSYSHYSIIFNWTVLGIFLYGLSMLFHKYFELIQKTSLILYFNMISAVINVILNFILIPYFGFQIAAIATFLSYLTYIILVYLRTRKHFKLKFNSYHLLVHLSFNFFYFVLDKILINNDSLICFFAEGIIYIASVILIYQFTNMFKITNWIRKKV